MEDSLSDKDAGLSSASSLWSRGQQLARAHPTGAAVALYGIVAIGAAITAYFTIFTIFQPYDDEGTLLVTVRSFVHGNALYRDIYTPYGPFYYELFGGFFSLTGLSVSTDASRLIVVVIWVASSGVYGLIVQRLTGRLLLGVLGMLVAYTILPTLINEPMHPQGLATLLLAGFLLTTVLRLERSTTTSAVLAGALVGALLMTKINLGIFAIAAVALAAVLSVEALYRRRWIRWPVVLAFLALPILVMARDLSLSWVRDLIAVEVLGTIALLVLASASPPRRGGTDRALARWIVGLAASCTAAVVAILIVLLATGPTLSDIYDGIVKQALRIRDAAILPLEFPPAAIDWGIAAVAVAVLVVRLGLGRGKDGASLWPGLLRLAGGVTIWLTAALASPLSLNPSGGRLPLPLVLVWIAAIPRSQTEESAQLRFLRFLLPATAIAQTLQSYPVAGSQVAMAAVTFVPVGALCIADGLWLLRRHAEARGAALVQRLGAVTAVVVVALIGKFGYESIVASGVTKVEAYRDQVSLDLPGASLLRIPAPQAEAYEDVVRWLHQYRCSTFVGYPSINSLYLWSGLEAPKPQLPGPWILLLDDPTQQRVVDELRASPRPCAIRDETVAGFWLAGKPVPNAPLVNYIQREFEPVREVGEFQFLLPRRSG